MKITNVALLSFLVAVRVGSGASKAPKSSKETKSAKACKSRKLLKSGKARPVELKYVYDNDCNNVDPTPGVCPKSPPLELCEGDCDCDGDCAPGLVCQKRDLADPAPAECTGTPTRREDYCALPILKYVYDNNCTDVVPTGVCPKSPPLQLCEGDCDSDGDCAPGLVCQERGSCDPAPAECTGTPTLDKDYCALPILKYVYDIDCTDVVPTGVCAKSPPLQLCEGDCDSDGDCAGTLVCQERGSSDPAPAECTGTPTLDKDYCARPILKYVYDNNCTDVDPTTGVCPKPKLPLQLCEGDCDGDSQCEGGLVCKKRGSCSPAPAECSGTPTTDKDYCAPPDP